MSSNALAGPHFMFLSTYRSNWAQHLMRDITEGVYCSTCPLTDSPQKIRWGQRSFRKFLYIRLWFSQLGPAQEDLPIPTNCINQLNQSLYNRLWGEFLDFFSLCETNRIKLENFFKNNLLNVRPHCGLINFILADIFSRLNLFAIPENHKYNNNKKKNLARERRRRQSWTYCESVPLRALLSSLSIN